MQNTEITESKATTPKDWTCSKCEFKGTESEVVAHAENCAGGNSYICRGCNREQNEVIIRGYETCSTTQTFSLEENSTLEDYETGDCSDSGTDDFICPRCGGGIPPEIADRVRENM